MVQETKKQTVQTENRSVKTPAMLYEPNDVSSERCLQTQHFLDYANKTNLKKYQKSPREPSVTANTGRQNPTRHKAETNSNWVANQICLPKIFS